MGYMVQGGESMLQNCVMQKSTGDAMYSLSHMNDGNADIRSKMQKLYEISSRGGPSMTLYEKWRAEIFDGRTDASL